MSSVVFTVQADAQTFSNAVDVVLGIAKGSRPVGGGRHVAAPRGMTIRYGDIIKRPTLNQWAYPYDSVVQGSGVSIPGSGSVQTLDSGWNGALPLIGPDMSNCSIIVSGCNAFIKGPTVPHDDDPWVWYSPTVGGFPDSNDQWTIDKLTARGFAVAGVDGTP